MTAFQKTTYKNLSKEESVRLNKFLCLPMEDLKKIKPVWVVKENKSEAYFGPFDEYEIEYIGTRNFRVLCYRQNYIFEVKMNLPRK